jgi:phosphatidylserine/phosphatidylglycerophosphate/cardiolipin synthase-like enzyme
MNSDPTKWSPEFFEELCLESGIETADLNLELRERVAKLADQAFRAGAHSGSDAGPQINLVWTGPETTGVHSRSTSVVCRELFREAKNQVIISSFAVYQGKEVFSVLAENMDRNPLLEVKMYLDVSRKAGDTTTDEILLEQFKQKFLKKEWPGKRTPELFHDPRSLSRETTKRSSLHAKCIVVDRQVCFATSANLTQAAQQRNIEAGFIIRSEHIAKQLAGHFEELESTGGFVRF